MINFFRKIRRKLADDNKPIKYARYAIGEIALVMIGILLAIQVNNWNEAKKEHKKEKEILTNLKINLLTNIEFIKEDIVIHKRKIRSGNIVIDAVRNKKTYYDSLAYHIHDAPIFLNPDLSYTGYESLKSVGFDIISNNELKYEIMDLFEVTYSNMTRFLHDSQNKISQSGYLQFYIENFERSYGMAIPNNYDELIKSQKFINILVVHRMVQLLGISRKQLSLTESERIIEMIDNELAKD